MIKRQLENQIANHRCTMLGVGPMSKNCVDAVIELSNFHNVPLMLIASRRQIDSESFGGGYVNNWTTQAFADYVIDNDKRGNVILARDHGGPWQNEAEKEQRLSLRRAMESAKASYRADIDAGLQVIHIDPSVDIHGTPTQDEILERVYELYEFCWNYAQETHKDIVFEVGTEEQSGSTNTQEELDLLLHKLLQYCDKNNLPRPTFVVIQTGTRVMETRNVGSLDSSVRVSREIPAEIQIPKMIEICEKHNIFMKEHNTDYLSNDTLRWHPRMGIHAANVAPEFGVAETRALLHALQKQKLSHLEERFVELSYNSQKWKKWMLPNTTATDYERSVISGHYVFSTGVGTEIIQEAALVMKSKGIDLHQHLKNAVKESIMRYMFNFRLVR